MTNSLNNKDIPKKLYTSLSLAVVYTHAQVHARAYPHTQVCMALVKRFTTYNDKGLLYNSSFIFIGIAQTISLI